MKEDVGKRVTKSQTLSRGPLSESFYGSLCVPKASFMLYCLGIIRMLATPGVVMSTKDPGIATWSSLILQNDHSRPSDVEA